MMISMPNWRPLLFSLCLFLHQSLRWNGGSRALAFIRSGDMQLQSKCEACNAPAMQAFVCLCVQMWPFSYVCPSVLNLQINQIISEVH
jgi:hypothetical protein